MLIVRYRFSCTIRTVKTTAQFSSFMVHVHVTLAQRERLAAVLVRAKFFHIQAYGTTVSGNIEDELFFIVYFDPYACDGKVHVRNNG